MPSQHNRGNRGASGKGIHLTKRKKIILTGGGTAGHVTPNLALVPLLREHGWDIRYIGTANGIERALVEKEDLRYYAVPAGKLRRYCDVQNSFDIFRIVAGFAVSLGLLAAKIGREWSSAREGSSPARWYGRPGACGYR